MKHRQNAIKTQNKGTLYTHTHTHLISENKKLCHPEHSEGYNATFCHASGCPIRSGMTEQCGRFTPSLSSSGLTRGSMVAQSGRSMIEMLGVLAVIGVLSVGGVYGYTIAMNKHRANELLNEASKRAVVCVAQIEAGNTPSVSDFGDYDGYTFTAAANPSNANQFQLTISGKDIPGEVCKHMKNTVGSSTPVRDINSNCTVLTYNSDMGTADVASGGGESATCKKSIVKIVACDGSVTDCCPDNHTCEQPVCECSSNSECPLGEACFVEEGESQGTCGCKAFDPWYEDYWEGELVDGICCAHGQTLDESKEAYQEIDTRCGCPEYATDMSGEKNLEGEIVDGICCARGFTLVNEGDWVYYGKIDSKCGCPYASDVSGEEYFQGQPVDGICCANGLALVDEGDWIYYGGIDSRCGCPNNGTQSLNDSSVCCYNNHAWNAENGDYDDMDPPNCGCPNNGTQSSSDPYKCCNNNRAWDDETGYTKTDLPACGCPDSGKVDSNVCCVNGFSVDREGDIIDIDPPNCGCPENGTVAQTDNRICCQNGKVFLPHEGRYMHNFRACSNDYTPCDSWESVICDSNQYCNYDEADDWKNDPDSGKDVPVFTNYSESGSEPIENIKGECKTLSNLGSSIHLDLDGDGTPETEVWKSPTTMSWWSASAWCVAHGKRLMPESYFSANNVKEEGSCGSCSVRGITGQFWFHGSKTYGSGGVNYMDLDANNCYYCGEGLEYNHYALCVD